MVYVVAACVLAAVVFGLYLRPRADKAVAKVEEHVADVKKAAEDVKKDLK